MNDLVGRQLRWLRSILLAFVATLAACAAIVIALPGPKAPALPQAGTLFWGVAFLAVANLATIMPSFRAMMAAPRRVFAVGRQAERLLAAHLRAYLVAAARVEAVALLGLLLFFLTGRRDWFWVLLVVATLGIALLWTDRSKIAALMVPPSATAARPS